MYKEAKPGPQQQGKTDCPTALNRSMRVTAELELESRFGTDAAVRRGSIRVAAELESRFGRFDAERKSAREQLQTRFVRWGFGVAALGVATVGVGNAITDLRAIAVPVGQAVLMAGLLSATMADHDLDEVFSRRRWLSVPIPVVWVLVMVALCLNLRCPAFAISALPYLYFFVRHRRVLDRAPGFPRWTQLGVSNVVGFLLGYAGKFIQWALRPGKYHISVAAAWALGAYYLLSAVTVATLYRRWAPRMAPSPCMWRCLYVVCVLRGVGGIVAGFASSIATHAYSGLAFLLPAAAFLLFGDAISGFLEQWFYRGRRLQDGGFIAELAQPAIMRVGDRHDWHDPASCSWHEGRVTAVDESTFDVRLVATAARKRESRLPAQT